MGTLIAGVCHSNVPEGQRFRLKCKLGRMPWLPTGINPDTSGFPSRRSAYME